MAEPQAKKRLAPKRKCKFNKDWKRDFAWIAKLPDTGMAQCNLCATDFSISGTSMYSLTYNLILQLAYIVIKLA